MSVCLPSIPLPEVPLSSLPPSHRPLFVYYRSRIETFEAERQDIIHRIHILAQHSGTTTSSGSAPHQSAAHIATLAGLERESSERRIQASEERRRRLECEAAMRTMAGERLADKKRLSQLLALTLPKRTAQQHFRQRNLPAHHTAHNKENHHTNTGQPAVDADEWKRLALAERAACSQSDKEWRRQVDGLAGERRRREKEWEARERQLVGWEEEARRERDKARVDLHDVMSEYMQLRHTAQHNERVALERLTATAAQQSQTLAMLRNHSLPHSANNAATAHSLLTSTASRSTSTRGDKGDEHERPWSSRGGRVLDERIIEYYAGDMHELTARNSQLSHTLRRVQEERTRERQAQQRLYGSASDECRRWKLKYERECERRALQCEGYETDVRRMRERLWTMEELLVHVGRGGKRRAGVDVENVIYGMDVEGAEAEVGAMDRQLATLTERLAQAEK